MMSIRSLADFNRSSLGGDGDWLTPPPSPPRPDKPGRHDERGMGTFNWPPARTSTWPYTGTFSWPRTARPAISPRASGQSYALRECSRALLAGSKPALASCSQVAAGGDRWLLMAIRGHLGGTLVLP